MGAKVIIHEFNPEIYPVRLWVAKNPSFEDVYNSYWGLTSELDRIEIVKEDFNDVQFKKATTKVVASKKDGWIGLLVCVWRPQMFDTATICHESAHCADFICEQFGIARGTFNEGEAYAYLIGWIASKLELGMKRKNK